MPPYSDPRTHNFGFYVPPPILRYNLAQYGLDRTCGQNVKHGKHGKQKLKSTSNRLRDKKRLENFIERKSLCAALPFSHLSDQELTDTFFEGMIFSKLMFYKEKLSRAEWKIKSLVAESDAIDNSYLNSLNKQLVYMDQIRDLNTHEAELENTNTNLIAALEQMSPTLEHQHKTLTMLQSDISFKEIEYSALKDKLSELEIQSDKVEEENFDSRRYITVLEAEIARLQQLWSPPVQYNRQNRPPDRGRRRDNFRHC